MSQYPRSDIQEEAPEPILAIGNDLDGNMAFLVDMLEKENKENRLDALIQDFKKQYYPALSSNRNGFYKEQAALPKSVEKGKSDDNAYVSPQSPTPN